MSKVDILSPVGRLVAGDPFKPQTTDMQGAPLTIKSGPKMGQPTQRYIANIAVAKNDPAWPAFYQKVHALCVQSWPQFWNGQAFTHPQFSMKIMDGDGTDGNGQPNATKEGYAGCWIIKFASSFAPRCFYAGRYQEHEQIKDPNLLKRGYFVRVGGTMESNNNPQKPGLYMNLGMMELVALGQEITSGPTASQVFGQAPAAALPAGAQPLPAYSGPSIPGVAPPAPLAAPIVPTALALPGSALPAALPVAAAMPAPVYVAPNPAILAGPAALPVALPTPTLPAAPRMSPTATHTYEQYRAAGHTDEAMRAAGVLL
jgi:Protein of unknown function (DUF2815)